MKNRILSTIATVLLAYCTGSIANNASAVDQSPNTASNQPSHLKRLKDNECLQKLSDHEEVLVSAAFHAGIGGYEQLDELIKRKPWGAAVSSTMKASIDKLLAERSPFLIMSLSKKHALALDDHRDLIKWVLVSSTTRSCQ